jgi:hypothetical protein
MATYSNGTGTGCKKAGQKVDPDKSKYQRQDGAIHCEVNAPPGEKDKACDPVDVAAGAQERYVRTGFGPDAAPAADTEELECGTDQKEQVSNDAGGVTGCHAIASALELGNRLRRLAGVVGHESGVVAVGVSV